MAIEIRLFGFGDDLPARFNGKNRLQVDIDTPTSVLALLESAGIEEAPDLIVMESATVVPQSRWGEVGIGDRTTLTIMSAIEGG